MADIICKAILGIILIIIAFICVALCISAGRYDRITEEQYEEYCRRNEDKDERQK